MKKIAAIFLGLFMLSSITLAKQNPEVFKKTLAIKSALQSALWGVDIKTKEHKSPKCERYDIEDIQTFDYKSKQYDGVWYSTWYEIWTIKACKDTIKIKIDFPQSQ